MKFFKKLKKVPKLKGPNYNRDLSYKRIGFISKILFLFSSIVSRVFFVKKIEEDLKIGKIDKKSPILFYSNHQSHLDYLFELKYIYKEFPTVQCLAGKNLDIFLIGTFFRHSNAVFVERGANALSKEYMKTLEIKLTDLFNNSIPVGIYPEGGRSRTGVVADFKSGAFVSFLRSIVYLNKDGFLVPGSILYDTPIESKSLLKENGKKKKDSFFKFLTTFNVIFNAGGAYYVGSGEPIRITPEQAAIHLNNIKDFLKYTKAKMLETLNIPVSCVYNLCLEENKEIKEDEVYEVYIKLCKENNKKFFDRNDFKIVTESLIKKKVIIRDGDFIKKGDNFIFSEYVRNTVSVNLKTDQSL